MRVFLIIFALVLLIGGIFWFVASTVREVSKEGEEPRTIETSKAKADGSDNNANTQAEKSNSTKDNLIVPITDKVKSNESVPTIKNENTSINSDNPKTNKENKAEKVIKPEKALESNSTVVEEIPILEKNEPVKVDTKKELTFIDENDAPLFGGKRIPIQEGKVEMANGVIILFTKLINENWEISIDSTNFFLDSEKNKIFKKYMNSFNINAIKENQTIILSAYSIIQVSLKYRDGAVPIPDNTPCFLWTTYFFNEKGIVKDGKAIFYVRISGVHSVTSFYSGKYYKNFNKELKLNHGEISAFDLDVEKGNEQDFRITDSAQKPLSGYFIYITAGEENSFGLSQIRQRFISQGKLGVGDTIRDTDKDGLGKIPFIANGNYVCHVFGNEHPEQIIKVVIDDSRKLLELILNNDEQVSLQLKVTLKNQPYLLDVDFTYYDMNEYSAMNFKSASKIVGGQLQIKNLKKSKYQFQLTSNNFFREKIELDFRESNSLEHIFDLKPTEDFIHGYVKDKKGNPLAMIQLAFSQGRSNFHTRIKTDANGYYKLGGLEKDKGYELYVSSDHPRPTGIPKLIYPSMTELNITLDDILYFSGKVLGVDGKPIDNFFLNLECYRDQNLTDSISNGGENFNGGTFKKMVYSYGYYEVTVRLPNAPNIRKVFPILKAEDNVEFVLQAVPGFSITGTVSDSEKTPVEGASLTRNDYHGPNVTKIYNEIIKTDKNGYFKLDNCLVDEKYFIVKVGYTPIPLITKEEDKNTPLNLQFLKTYKLTGSLIGNDKKPHRLIQVVGDLKGAKRYQIVSETDADGKFFVASVPPGEWYIYFNIRTGKGKKKPGKWVTIVDKDEEVNIEYDIPKE